jgi:membrane fusion protein (multidrug efflux system)
MKKSNFYAIISMILITLTVASCSDAKQSSPQGQNQIPTFEVATLSQKTIIGNKTYPTNIEGIVNSDVRAKVTGYIQKVLVDEGQHVKKGQPLFKLETQSLTQDAEAAKAAINVAQVEVDKLVPLVEKGIVSNVQLETQKARLLQAKSNYNSIIANIDYATVKSQIDGFVGAIPYREGSLVSPNNDTPLTTVSDITKVFAYFSMNEKEYLDFLQSTEGKTLQDKLNNFPKVSLILANGAVYPEQGKIETSTGQINRKTGTVSIRAVFNNPNQLLTNGNSGKIRIPTTYENAMVVPQEATYEQQGQVMVFKLGEDNTISTSTIKIKASVDNLYVVESGISLGDKIVASGVGKLKSDMTITPQEVPFDSIIKPIKTVFKN